MSWIRGARGRVPPICSVAVKAQKNERRERRKKSKIASHYSSEESRAESADRPVSASQSGK
jgi:hypothetical protein